MQPVGKIKTEQPHAGRTSIRDIVAMLKLRLNVAPQRIQDFLEVFFMFFQYKMRYLVVSKKIIHYSCEGGIVKSDPRQAGDPQGRFFYPTLTLMMDSYNTISVGYYLCCCCSVLQIHIVRTTVRYSRTI